MSADSFKVVEENTQKAEKVGVKTHPDTPINSMKVKYSKQLNDVIRKVANVFFNRYRNIAESINLFELEDWAQEGWLFICKKEIPKSEDEIVRILSNHFKDLVNKARNRMGIIQEINYSDLNDSDRAKYDNEVYGIYGDYEDYGENSFP